MLVPVANAAERDEASAYTVKGVRPIRIATVGA
jgi:hypothetical protein